MPVLSWIPANLRGLIVGILGSMGLISVDAVLHADNVRLTMTVSSKVAADGITQSVAEDFFLHDINRIAGTRSLVLPPSITTTNEKSIVSVIAGALKLDDFTAAVQSTMGIDMAQLTGTLTTEQGRTTFVLAGHSPATGAFDLEIPADGISTRQLLRVAAYETMLRLDPYQAYLYRLGQPMTEAERQDLERSLKERIDNADLPSDGNRRALFYNLLGILYLLGDKLDDAERQFARTVEDHPALAAGPINLAFLRVHQDRYREAIEVLARAEAQLGATMKPELQMSLYTTWGVAAWGMKDLTVAERMFRTATERMATASSPYIYWAGMLTTMGRGKEAAEKRAKGVANMASFQEFPEVANLWFWLAPTDNAPLTRRSDPPPTMEAAPAGKG